MDTNLFLANAAFGVALALFGILIRVLFARVATNERSSNERFAQLDSRMSSTEAMHVGTQANHASLKELFDYKFQSLQRDLDDARGEIKRFRELLSSVQEQVHSVYHTLETVKILLDKQKSARNV